MTVDINPASAIARNARHFGDQVAVRYAGGDLTYLELDERAARVAGVLAGGGIGRGDRVAYLGLNSAAFLVTMLGCFRLGAVFVPVNFRLAGPELEQVLVESGAICAIVEDGHRSAVDMVRAGTRVARFLLVDDDPACPVTDESPGWERWASVLSAAEPAPGVAAMGFEDLGILMFTSGTTGLPKGVMLTHGNIWWNAFNVDSRLDTRRDDVTHAAAPLFHIGALNSFVMRALVRGGTVVVRRGFDPFEFVDDVTAYGVNSTFMVPAMLAALPHVPGFFDTDLSSLRSVVVAGAPVPPSLIQRFADHGLTLQQAWGLTETAPFATHLPAERTLTKLGSAGISMPQTEVRVIDTETGAPLPPGASGEVVVRGPNVTPGYWQNPEATALAFDEEGWFHSGDIGYLDDDDCLFIVDRLKDMIISGGENVYPAEVERALSDLDGVSDVAVIGVPDKEWGEAVVAVISIADGHEVTIGDVRKHAATRIARYKLPRRLQIVQTVPRNASGKLDKLSIRALVEDE